MIRRWLWTMVAVGAMVGCGGSAEKADTPPAAGTAAEDHSGHAHTQGEPATPGGAIAIEVTEDGFVPAEVTVARGEPVTLVVTRRTEKTCATEFVMKAQGIEQKLPMNEPVTISFTPTEVGELRYACGMDMIAGKVIVK